MAPNNQIICQRCGAILRAVAFLDLEKDRRGEELDVYCGDCSKILERDALRSWASRWAKGIADEEHHENFFKILAAVWEQGFTKARTFEEAAAVFGLLDNPFIAESELIDPLKKAEASRQEWASPQTKKFDEDEYYEQNPTFRESHR